MINNYYVVLRKFLKVRKRIPFILNSETALLMLQFILDETKEGNVSLDDATKKVIITKEAFNEILDDFCHDGFITISENKIIVSRDQRIKIARKAIELGADFERISKPLEWLEFEELVALVFRENGYNTKCRYRFMAEGRRWEIDVLATSYPYVICTECKHYTSGMGNSVARKIIETHIEKTQVLSKHIAELAQKIGIHKWKKALVIPITLTLSATKMNIYRRVPSVSVYMLPSFLSEFPGYIERMTTYPVQIPDYKPKPKQIKLR
jgi:hypothetical protein